MSTRPQSSSYFLLGPVLVSLVSFATGCPRQAEPDCTNPSELTCSATHKQAELRQIVVGELGKAKGKSLMMVDISLASLQPGQAFVCQAEVLRNGQGATELSSRVTLEVRPPSLGCRSAENGAALRVRCQPGAGEPSARALIVPASESSELIQTALICTPEPGAAVRAVAAAPSASPPADPAPGSATKRTPSGADSGNRRGRTPPHHPPPNPRPLRKETVDDSPVHVASPATTPPPIAAPAPVIKPAPAVAPPVTPPPPEPPASTSFGVDAVGELPRLVLTLVACDDPHFHAGAGGTYRISGFNGKFHVEDAGQCQIALVSGVKSDEEVKKIKGSIALRW